MMAKLVLAFVLAGVIYIWWRGKIVAASAMRPTEARRLLGVAESATVDEVREAHRRLIARVHPDAGGSAELATRVNAARDALLSELKKR